MRSLLYLDGKINRWLVVLLAAAIALPALLIILLGGRLHRILSRLAGGIIGEIKDNLGVVVACSVLCVVGVWVFILVKCWAEGRTENRVSNKESGTDQI